MNTFTIRTFSFALVLVIASMGSSVYSSEISDKQKTIIYNEAIKVLSNYEQFTNQMAEAMGNVDELNKVSQRLIDQFVSRKAIIFNDLDPSYKLSEAYELETYVANMLLWYPDGMKIALDFKNLKAGNIISHGNDIFTVDIMTQKSINGNYINRQQNSNKEELLFRIAFFQKGNSFENYKIAGVRSSKKANQSYDSKMLAEVKSVEFSEKEMQLIKDQTRYLLNDYINFLNLISDPKESGEDKSYYRISFMGLFKDSTLKVANDIEPDPQNRWVSVVDYQQSIETSYPEGIRNIGMNIDSAQYGKVIPEGNEKYYINGYIDKFFSGKYMGKTIHRDNSKYDFKVSFERSENTFKNFKLTSIDKFGVNLYDKQSASTSLELPQKSITSLKRQGLYIGFAISGGVSSYSDQNLTSSSLLSWNQSGKNALNAEAFATWYFHNRAGVTLGLGYSSFSANASLNGNFRSTEYFTDVNEELYLKNVDAAYDSLLTFGYLSVPITFTVHSNSNPEKWGIFVEAGLVASFNINSAYATSGNFATSGYYEQYPIGLQTISAPEFGFITRNNISTEGKSNAAGVLISARTAIGVSWPINYFTTLHFGPEVTWGLTSLSGAKESTDAFGETTPAKKVAISKYGIKFGVNYKF
jgi:hypothetical protein